MKLLKLFLAFLLILEAPAHAVGATTPLPLPQIFKTSAKIARSNPAAGLQAAGVKESASSHAVQLLITMYVAAMIEGVRQQHEEAIGTGKNFNLKEGLKALNQSFLIASDQILNNFEVWLSFVGTQTIDPALRSTVNEVLATLKVSESRSIMKTLLTSGANSLASFTVWEGISQAWIEGARANAPEDLEAALNLKIWNVIQPNNSEVTQRQRMIFAKTVWNMVTIMASTPLGSDRGKIWIYNTWRQRIAKGDFITLVASMTLIGCAVGSVVPVAGNAVGAMFGLSVGVATGISAVGGAVATGVGVAAVTLIVPEEWNGKMTYSIQDSRIWTNTRSLNAQKEPTVALYEHIKTNNDQRYLNEFNKRLGYRRYYREHLMSIYFERYYTANLLIQESQHILKLYKQANAKSAEAKEIRKKYEDRLSLGEQLKISAEYDLMQFYSGELNALFEMFKVSNDGQLEAYLPEALQKRIQLEIENVTLLKGMIMGMVLAISPNSYQHLVQQLDSDTLQALIAQVPTHLENSNIMGFSEGFYLDQSE